MIILSDAFSLNKHSKMGWNLYPRQREKNLAVESFGLREFIGFFEFFGVIELVVLRESISGDQTISGKFTPLERVRIL